MRILSLGAGKQTETGKKITKVMGNKERKVKNVPSHTRNAGSSSTKNQSLAGVVSSTAGMKCSSAHAAHSSVNFSLTPSGSF
jgi:hypothetical protein